MQEGHQHPPNHLASHFQPLGLQVEDLMSESDQPANHRPKYPPDRDPPPKARVDTMSKEGKIHTVLSLRYPGDELQALSRGMPP